MIPNNSPAPISSLALLSHTADLGYFRGLFTTLAPQIEVHVWPDPRCLGAQVAVGWNPPAGVYTQMPQLRLIHGIAAGVDNLLANQQIADTPVCRVVDTGLAQGMFEYVLHALLHFQRNLDLAASNQRIKRWERKPQRSAQQVNVGVMGLGQLGGEIASRLAAFGYNVHGWARTPRQLAQVKVFAGEGQLLQFLQHTEVLVCLLPLTEATRGILGARTFDALPRGACLVHCGRGEHLCEAELFQALRSGQLRGAFIDVFAQEPLTPQAAFWDEPGVYVTPHMASMASPQVIAEQVMANVRRLEQGLPLLNQVDIGNGY